MYQKLSRMTLAAVRRGVKIGEPATLTSLNRDSLMQEGGVGERCQHSSSSAMIYASMVKRMPMYV